MTKNTPIIYPQATTNRLRDPEKVNRILGELRSSVDGLLTVKMRIGFENTDSFDRILDLINQYDINLLSLHGRSNTPVRSATVLIWEQNLANKLWRLLPTSAR